MRVFGWILMTLTVVFTKTKGFVLKQNASPSPPHTSSTSMEMALTLYGSQGSRSPLVNWAAYELGVDLKMGNLAENPHPFGQIPCLTDDDDRGTTVFESGAILLYLSSKAGQQSGEIFSWVSWANASLDPICFLETPEGKVYDTGMKKPNKRIERLNSILGDSEFLVGDAFSVADVAVASYLLYVIQFFPGVDLSRWPNVVKYMGACAERPAYGKAFGANVQAFLLDALSKMGSGEKKMFGIF